MLVTLNGNIATEVKSSYMMKNGQYITDQRTGKPLVVTEFSMAVNRSGKSNREKTTLDGKTYTSDLYRIKAIGQKAEYLAQYGSKGRSICVHGHLFQDEYLANNQTVQIDKTNPLYQALAQYLNVPGSPIKADQMGNLYILGNTQSRSLTVEPIEVEFNGANPNNNNQMFDPSVFNPNTNMNGFNPVSNGNAFNPGQSAPSFNTNMPIPGTQVNNMASAPNFNTNAGMPFQQQSAMPQFNNQNQQQGMPQFANAQNGVSMQQPQVNPTQQGAFPGWGTASQAPESFTNIQQPTNQTAMPQMQPQQAPAQAQQQATQAPQQTQAQAPQEQPKQEESVAFSPEKSGAQENLGF